MDNSIDDSAKFHCIGTECANSREWAEHRDGWSKVCAMFLIVGAFLGAAIGAN